MAAVRSSSTEPVPDRPEKRPRLDSAEPAMHIAVEPSPPLPVHSAAVEVDSGPADYARNPPPNSLHPAAEPAQPEPQQTNRQPSTALSKRAKRRRVRSSKRRLQAEPFTGEWIVAYEAGKLLGKDVVEQAVAESRDWDPPFEDVRSCVLELTVSRLSSTGDSLSVAPAPHRPWVIITPHAMPGEKIRVRVHQHARMYSYADLLEVIEPNPEWRDMSRVKCKYFGKCGGCQFQMLSYEKQLELKREVVVRAYESFSNLPSSAVPKVSPTIGSPLQYNYRTKLTPHFEAPKYSQGTVPPIGFNIVKTRKVMDIEECPIATEPINAAYKPLREQIIDNIYTYKKGVSLCLRDSLELTPLPSGSPSPARRLSPMLVPLVAQQRSPSPPPFPTAPPNEKHICTTDHKATVRERVGDKIFEFGAGSFFQNNNSILVPLTSYVRSAIFNGQAPIATNASAAPPSPPRRVPTHLIDAYCGSGLFAITLAQRFYKVAGIEIAAESIAAATRNAELNHLRPEQCTFLEGDAADVFRTVADFPRERTALIIDPPRKGTDDKFISQMIAFGCETVVYVSCNVHTQARDVGMIIRKSEQNGVGPDKRKYVLESVRGFDLFPQTAHVESVAVLRLA
ncbi:hypothetical protein EVJ58_g3233 [Rhodofomes roseus]|uniref:TRAM domain-containing protein n=1 Tax=Rhodofomes roseus TaxID=34475 RepID=A0A4Y9YLM6_9APHY|nr:hypothetical protein EVJ58_g3233 [Rhodofomes roseus]